MASCDGFAPPTPLLSGLVRNAREARAIVDLDVQALRHEVLHDHLLACCAHERDLERLRSALEVHAHDDSRLHTARVLCASALATARRDIDLLVNEADAVLRGVAESAGTLRRYAESNDALAQELEEEGSAPAVAAAKQRLWLVEESLVARADAVCRRLQAALSSASTSGGEREDAGVS